MHGSRFACECGRTHSNDSIVTLVQPKAIAELVPILAELEITPSSCTIVADSITFSVAGDAVTDQLSAAGWEVSRCLLDTAPTGLVSKVRADERSVGTLLMELPRETDLLVAVGSGTVTDVTRFVAARTGKRFVSVATAPSVDAYTSCVSPMTHLGRKATEWGIQPSVVLADTEILREAPLEMRAAGFGDTIGKLTGKADWMLARVLESEYFCAGIANTVADSAIAASERAEEVGTGDERGIRATMESLSMSGAAMAMVGDSRPAAGSEHMISHYLEMFAAQHGHTEHLHGTKVGIGTVLMTIFWNRFASRLSSIDPGSIDLDAVISRRRTPDSIAEFLIRTFGPGAGTIFGPVTSARLADEGAARSRVTSAQKHWEEFANIAATLPPAQTIAGWLNSAGGPAYPGDIGVGRDELRNTLYGACEVRLRTTVLTVAEDLGWLDEIVDEVVEIAG